MRVLVMMLAGVVLVGLLFVGMFGPIELALWMILVIAWTLALIKWAIPRDRAQKLRESAIR
jgi:hypothetical protein